MLNENGENEKIFLMKRTRWDKMTWRTSYLRHWRWWGQGPPGEQWAGSTSDRPGLFPPTPSSQLSAHLSVPSLISILGWGLEKHWNWFLSLFLYLSTVLTILCCDYNYQGRTDDLDENRYCLQHSHIEPYQESRHYDFIYKYVIYKYKSYRQIVETWFHISRHSEVLILAIQTAILIISILRNN